MKRKPIKIDWDELEEAFADPQEETETYLDGVTGRVVLAGEGEEHDLDDARLENPLAVTAPPVHRVDPTRIPIRPPDTEQKIDWMREFLEVAEDIGPAVVDEFSVALDDDDPVPLVTDLLKRHPDVRDAWYLYRSERIQEMIDEWLRENGVEVIEPPPWR
jgi:hypothetical protein